MKNYVERMIHEFPMKISSSDTDLTPDGNNIFDKCNRKSLGKKETEEFHTSVAIGIVLDKRAIPDIHQTFAVLLKRVKEPNDTDWKELLIMIEYLNGKKRNYLTLSTDDLKQSNGMWP